MDLPIIELTGSATAMGEAFGEQCRADIHELYAIRMSAAIRFAAAHGRTLAREYVLGICRDCVLLSKAYDALGYAEFAGIARGAGISPEQCYALQGLTDLRDLLAFASPPDGFGCSSFIVAPERAAAGQLLLGQNWDLQTDNMPYVRLVHRRPEDAPETWSLTLTGCLTLIGVSSEGIAVGNTNLVTRDAKPGVQYLTVLHRALRSRSFTEAVESIRGAPRSGAHYYYLGGPHGQAVGLECSAGQDAAFEVSSGTFVHCNHALSDAVASLEVQAPGVSTLHRQGRLEELLAAHDGEIAIADLKRFLSDHEGGDRRCICRHDCEGISTNASVILSPGTFEIHACCSQPHVGRWVTGCARATDVL